MVACRKVVHFSYRRSVVASVTHSLLGIDRFPSISLTLCETALRYFLFHLRGNFPVQRVACYLGVLTI